MKRSRPLTYDEALSRAAALCAKCEQCTPDLRRKMDSWGLSASDICRAIGRLQELGFVDDSRFARAYAHDKLVFSGWGRKRLFRGCGPNVFRATILTNRLTGLTRRNMTRWPEE